jgi:hypothetical protein
MALKQVLEAFELLSAANVNGEAVVDLLRSRGIDQATSAHVNGPNANTDFVSCLIPGARNDVRTLGIVGRLGGVGARPTVTGMVSDADGAVVALAVALKIADMAKHGDRLPGSVRVHTHVCPQAAVRDHKPVPMMRSPLPMQDMMRREVHPDMAAILSIDATKGNRLVNRRGVAITPSVKEGYVLKVPDVLLDLLAWVSGELPMVVPITTQDITPSENGVWHINSIMQPATATTAPVVGVALTAQSTVPGCASGANHAVDLDVATRFCIEVAKAFGEGRCAFYDAQEWELLQRRYGSLARLQTLGQG